MTALSGPQALQHIDRQLKKDFDANRRLLSFDEYLSLVAEAPERHLRGSAQYLVDMLDHYGREKGKPDDRFKVFDFPVDGIAPKVIGHEEVQNQIYKTLKSFSRQGANSQLILLHGPNGSAKSTLIHALMNGVERFSNEAAGATYTFSWVFPLEKGGKGGIGIQGAGAGTSKDSVDTYARLPDEQVAARLPCDLNDHPLLLIPRDMRLGLLESLLGKEKAARVWSHAPNYLKQGDLSHQAKLIFDALFTAAAGDLKKVLRHVQVERLYFERRYRKGLVTIEPQMHVDAHYQLVSYNKSLGNLPASLQSLNLFTLGGDLVDGNRGIVEYSDLLKRPIDSFKYLLGLCEAGFFNVGNTIAYTDTVLIGSANELQLDAFKEFPDFSSFKGRIHLIRVPYLMKVHQEQELYKMLLPSVAGEKAISPHVDRLVALWSVLTRLRKPHPGNYPSGMSTLIGQLSPIQKARLYDHEELPPDLTADEKNILKSLIPRLREEYDMTPAYEGRMGASVREMKELLYSAAQNPEFACLSPLAVFRELENFVKRVSEYEFLRQEVKDGYHDALGLIETVEQEYLGILDHEVRDSIGLYESRQWEDFLRRYVLNISLILKKEKTKNNVTGQMEDPDLALTAEFEKIVGAPERDPGLEEFRRNILTQLGAWKLDHPKEEVIYSKVFPDYWRKLEQHYFESQKALLLKMRDAVHFYDRDDRPQNEGDLEGAQLARKTIDNLVKNYGYTVEGAREVIIYLMKRKY